ncbi:MAG: hypothetical protein NC098_03180 [Lachnoclostridium sp.]|nr:hypothetical protein [Lachnoclostridium sp.]
MGNRLRIDCFYEELPEGGMAFRRVDDFFSGVYHPQWENAMEAIFGRIRYNLHDGKEIYRCADPNCGGKIFLAGGENNPDDGKRHPRLHFKHGSGQQSPECRYRPDKNMSKAQAERLGHANKEQSPIHFILKRSIADVLGREFPDARIDIEKRIKEGESRGRQPDINIKFPADSDFMPGKEIDIEVQVSYILIARVKERKEDHKADGRPILWIFDKFDKALYQYDIIERNELNAFVLDDEARLMSIRENKLYIHVYYPTFEIVNNKVRMMPQLNDEIISFDSLKLDEEACELYYVRSKTEREELENKAIELLRLREIEEAERKQISEVEANDSLHQEVNLDEYWNQCQQFQEKVDTLSEEALSSSDAIFVADFADNNDESRDYLFSKFCEILRSNKDDIMIFGTALNLLSRMDASRLRKAMATVRPIVNDLIYRWATSSDNRTSPLILIRNLAAIAPERILMIARSPHYAADYLDLKWAQERIESFRNKYVVKSDGGELINKAPKDDPQCIRELYEQISIVAMVCKIKQNPFLQDKLELFLNHTEFFLMLQSLKQGFVSYGKLDNYFQLANCITYTKKSSYLKYLSGFIQVADYYDRDLKNHRNKIISLIDNNVQAHDLDELINTLIYER